MKLNSIYKGARYHFDQFCLKLNNRKELTAMRITISGKNVEITDALRSQIIKKVSKLERYFDDNTEVQVTMSVERDRHIMEVTIPFNGVVIRAEEYTDDMYKTLDNVLDKLERQIHKYRTKLDKRMKEGAFKYEKPLFSDQFEEEVNLLLSLSRRSGLQSNLWGLKKLYCRWNY